MKITPQKTTASTPKNISNWVIAGLLALVTLVVLSPVVIFHTTTFFVNLDNVNQFYTWYQKLATSWHSGYLPIWNANVFSGQSFAGELQPGVFYPLNLLWVAIFGSAKGISVAALDWLVVVHFWIAALGCYLLLKQIGARSWAAFLAGATFAFSGVVAFRPSSQTAIFFGLALLPYSLYFLIKFHSDAKKRWLVWSGIFLGALLLAGHIQPFFHALLGVALIELSYIYKAFDGWRNVWPRLWSSTKTLLLIGLATCAIALPQLWISAGYLPHAYRVQATGFLGPNQKIDYGHFAKSYNIDIHEFSNLVDPVTYPIRDGNSIFIGLAGLGVIGLAIFVARSKFKATTLWGQHSFFVTSLLVLSFLSMIGYATWFAVVLYKLPFVYQIRQLGRYSILFDLGLAMVLAAALEAMVAVKLTGRQRRNLVLVGGFLAVNGVYLFLLRQYIFSLHLALHMGLVGLTVLAFVAFRAPSRRRLAVSILLLATLSVNTLWFLPQISSSTELPVEYNLPTGLVKTLTQTNGNYRINIKDDTLPVNIGNVYNVQTVGGYAATMYAPYYEVTNSTTNKDFVDDLLGVRLVVAKAPGTGQLVYSDPARSVYVNLRPTALPKMFTTKHAGSLLRGDYQAVNVTTLKYSDQNQKYRLNISSDSDVIISEIYYSGWQAVVDGKPAPIKAYNVAGHPLLKQLHIAAGAHAIELSYKPFGLF